jgi:hypothetical protein
MRNKIGVIGLLTLTGLLSFTSLRPVSAAPAPAAVITVNFEVDTRLIALLDEMPPEISIQFATYAPNASKIYTATSTGRGTYSVEIPLNQKVNAIGVRVNSFPIQGFDNKGNIITLATTGTVLLGPVLQLPNPVLIPVTVKR